MIRSIFSLSMSVLLLACGAASASTWNEPWHDEVLREADAFGYYEVIAIDAHRIELRRLKAIEGEDTGEAVVVDGLYRMGEPHAHDDHGQDETLAWLRKGDRGYFLLKRHGATWQLPTPSAGVAPLRSEDSLLAATYRISFHQALQAPEAYERVHACLFRATHGGTCDPAALAADLDAPLREAPAAPGEDATESQRFFRQHVALESAALLDRNLSLAILEPFLAFDFFHVQMSAVRALAASDDPGRDERLLAFVKDDTRWGAARIMAVRLAGKLDAPALRAALKAWEADASDDEEGMHLAVGSIMDPRIGTRYPRSLRAAIGEL